MQFNIIQHQPQAQQADCLVVGLFASGKLAGIADTIDQQTGGALSYVFSAKDHQGELGDIATLYRVPGVNAERVVIVGLGEEEKWSASAYQKAVNASIQAVKQMNVTTMLSTLTDCAVPDYPIEWQLRQAVQWTEMAVFKVARFKTDENSQKPQKLENVTWYLSPEKDAALAEMGILQGKAIAEGMILTREVADLPANICTPTYLAQQAVQMAERYGFGVSVFDRDEIEAMGMGAFLSVTKGSDEAPKFIVLHHGNVSPENKPIVLVGKGITFDTGGISLKPANDMDEMKYDMCGAATVLGVFTAVGELKLDIDLVGIIPTCENMPSGHATRPGDIVTSMLGKTIEILNTDAEGRLILVDALAYARRYEPSAIVNMATLTGACVVALGYHTTGLMANDDDLAQALLEAGKTAQDRAWQLPLWPEYQEQIKGRFADIINSAGRDGGTITAGCFLSRFTEGFPWAHLDIAGTASCSGKNKGATGRPVPLLMTWLMTEANKRKANQ